MPPRTRGRQSPDPEEEREFSRERGRQVQNPDMEREVRNLRARMEDMETSQRCKADAGDISESEDEGDVGHREEKIPEEDAVSERLLKVVARLSTKVKMDVPVYEGNLDAEELLDWIRALDTYFDYEDIEEDKKVRHAVTRLKGHAALWWDELQVDRRCRQAEDKELGQDDCKDEGKIHSQGLSNFSIQKDAEPETEADDSERVY
jgi:hypothetical protein